ncbi:MAG TPA: hypothetical protein VF950_24750 [Planctomycetota bacterium]
MDRESTFANDETLKLLRDHYVAYAPSVTEMLKARDAAGDFFRKVVNQRAEPKHSKQGYYICAPDGTLLKGWMYPRPDNGTMTRNLKEVHEAYKPPADVAPLDRSKVDRNATPLPPEGGLVIEVAAKLLEAKWQATNLSRYQMIRDAVGKDRLWATQVEARELAKGSLPNSFVERLIRFHLVDNTRGVHARWMPEHLKSLRIQIIPDGKTFLLEGSLLLEEAGNRRFEAQLRGVLEAKGDVVTRFDVLVRGTHVATKSPLGELPLGPTTLAVAFGLAEPGESTKVPPLYSWLQGEYLRSNGQCVSALRNTATK